MNKIKNFFEIYDWRKLVLFVLAIGIVAGGTVATVMYQIHTANSQVVKESDSKTITPQNQQSTQSQTEQSQNQPTTNQAAQQSTQSQTEQSQNQPAPNQAAQQATQTANQPTQNQSRPSQPTQNQPTPAPRPTPQPQPTPPVKNCRWVEYKKYPPKGHTEPKYTYPNGNYEIIVYIDEIGNYEARLYNKDGKFLKAMPGSSYEIRQKEVCD